MPAAVLLVDSQVSGFRCLGNLKDRIEDKIEKRVGDRGKGKGRI